MTHLRRYAAILLVLGLPLFFHRSGAGAEIPGNLVEAPDRAAAVAALQHAGLPAEMAEAQAATLDRVELAELAGADLEQRGGNALVAIAFIAACVFVFYILIKHIDETGHCI